LYLHTHIEYEKLKGMALTCYKVEEHDSLLFRLLISSFQYHRKENTLLKVTEQIQQIGRYLVQMGWNKLLYAFAYESTILRVLHYFTKWMSLISKFKINWVRRVYMNLVLIKRFGFSGVYTANFLFTFSLASPETEWAEYSELNWRAPVSNI